MLPPIARRFVAGETPATALEHARECNDRDIGAILNLLGEHYEDPTAADDDARAYAALLADLGGTDLDACISVKPTQIGLDVSEARFRDNLRGIVDAADEYDRFVWIDMEDHTTTDATLDAFEEFVEARGGGLGVCLQANLKRTRGDLERFRDVPGKIRLVKGAYDEPPAIAYKSRERINEVYQEHLEYLFEHYEGGIALGSHDPVMIDRARELHAEHDTDFEIQMLMGVREDAQEDLAREYEVYQYAPYGGKWLSYFYRRMMERKENAGFALRAILGR
ncbi:proline dehydrogenase family protein [Halalkalicoccus jeotgali]|uniref:proline dehydrogenase n=1 Tax=Halalkalicoccus jeotgali (strain DSM 18796 / CECT 7217 / JCM 14584 / KCTC 4019 / B3) TaxID=795797 RepID=D8J524_HALJB|nr:proline dehydrogenase family protein [Halalkalicoccus jeotgali]ADJ13605.1 Proline dehydrogenase [Halalkalicoccus jeotgali B3]ELY33373.1 Proline dehydrogenase [Halalkalicoccus jeotgali B3]